MRWLTFIAAAYLLLGIQSGIGDILRWGSATPNLMLMLVVLVALNASRDAALLGCLILGFVHDLASGGPIGLMALAYGLAALMLVQVQQLVYRDNPITHFFATFVAALVVMVVAWVQGQVRPLSVGVEGAIRVGLSALFLSALYTAALAPVVLWPLVKAKWLFSFQPSRKRLRV